MKQHFKMAALSLAVISSTNAFAQDSSEPEYKNWFGLSGMYYNTDDSRPLDLTDGGLYDDGRGVAFEYGFRFTQSATCPSLNGTKVRLRANGSDQWRFIVNGDSYRSQQAPIAHFGLKQTKSVEEVEVHWPDGKRTMLKKPRIGQYHNIKHNHSHRLINPAE